MEGDRPAARLQRLSGRYLGWLGLLAVLGLSSLLLSAPPLVHASGCQSMGMDWQNVGGAGANGTCPMRSGGRSQPPGVSSGGLVKWSICVSAKEFIQLDATYAGVWPTLSLRFVQGSPFWVLSLASVGISPVPQLRGETPVAQCAAPPPPPPQGNPWIYQQFAIWAWVPLALWDGTSSCPPGSTPGSACPPSVGAPVHTWVAGFVDANGARTATSPVLSDYLGYDTWQGTLTWVQQGAIRWDWNDETVNGQRILGQNYGVPEAGLGPAFAVSHTYDYASDYNPLGNCVRPCPGEQLGPPLPGYPNGAPAFQVQIQTTWRLRLCQRWTSGTSGGNTCTFLDLRTLGAPARDFVSTNLVPLPVLQYGASPP